MGDNLAHALKDGQDYLDWGIPHQTIRIKLDNASGAIAKQDQLFKNPSSEFTASNNCVTHVIEVLKAGGVSELENIPTGLSKGFWDAIKALGTKMTEKNGSEAKFAKIQIEKKTFPLFVELWAPSFDAIFQVDRVLANEFDPLTSKGGRIGSIATQTIIEITQISTPYKGNFVIDSWELFYHYQSSEPSKLDDDCKLRFFEEFLNFVEVENLLSDDQKVLTKKVDDKFYFERKDFNELGLDFLRQHYRETKQMNLSHLQLNRVFNAGLVETRTNRTKDSDWQFTSVPNC